MFIGNRLTAELVTVRPDDKILSARRIMLEKKIRHLPVVDEKGKLIGIVSDRDIRDAMPSKLSEQSAEEVIGEFTVADIMSKDPVTIREYHTLQDALLVMHSKKVGAFPVIDEAGTLKGIISTRDIMKAFINMLNIEEQGTLLCIVVEEKPGQLKKVVDIISEEKISLGSVLVGRHWDENRRAIFPYLLTCNVATVKRRLMESGFELIEPMDWYLDQMPQ